MNKIIIDADELRHSGTKGQKWYVRNYQYPDGTWTELGKERRRIGSIRYGKGENEKNAKVTRKRLDSKHIAPMMAFMNTMRGINDPDSSNPNDTKNSDGRWNNCTYCAVAYELRKHGVTDAKAPSTVNPVSTRRLLQMTNKKYPDFFKINGHQGISRESLKDLIYTNHSIRQDLSIIKKHPFSDREIRLMTSELISQGNGARGFLSYQYTNKSGKVFGHVENYEIANNTMYLLDCQSNKVSIGMDYLANTAFRMMHIRTDDAIIDIDEAKRFLTKV